MGMSINRDGIKISMTLSQTDDPFLYFVSVGDTEVGEIQRLDDGVLVGHSLSGVEISRGTDAFEVMEDVALYGAYEWARVRRLDPSWRAKAGELRVEAYTKGGPR